MNRRAFLTALGGSFLAAPLAAEARQAGKVPRIGLLRDGTPAQRAPMDIAFRQALRDLGYVEGQNVVIEARYTGEQIGRLPEIAAELVRLKVDIIVTSGTPGAKAAKAATTSIPIVVAAAGDFVGAGLVASLSRPGGNVTGTSDLTPELSGKWLELLKEIIPGVTRVGVLWNGGNPGAVRTWDEIRAAAHTLGLELQSLKVRGLDDLETAFARAATARVPGLVVAQDPFTVIHRRTIVRLAARHRLPAVYGGSLYVEAGGLISYGSDQLELWRRAALYVDKILKGAKPADLPVEQPTKFELVINLKTAKALGLTIPQSLLQRADEIIQ